MTALCIKCQQEHSEADHECLEVMGLEELFASEHAKLKGLVPQAFEMTIGPSRDIDQPSLSMDGQMIGPHLPGCYIQGSGDADFCDCSSRGRAEFCSVCDHPLTYGDDGFLGGIACYGCGELIDNG